MNLPKSKYFDFCLNATAADYLQEQFKEHGTFDAKISEWLIDNVKPGWIIYDVGANIFEYSEVAARLAGPTGAVYSFEPQRRLVDGYKIARKYNNYDGVAPIHIYNVGLGDRHQFVQLMSMSNNLGASSISHKFVEYSKEVLQGTYYDSEVIEIVRADSLNLPPVVPDLLKLDIEGSEPSFWLGAPDFLKQAKNIIIEVGPYTDRFLIDELSANRDCYLVKEGCEFDPYWIYDENNVHNQFDLLFVKR